MTTIEYGLQNKSSSNLQITDVKNINKIQNMVFKITELRSFLSSIHKRKIEKINIQSSNFALMISTEKIKSTISASESHVYQEDVKNIGANMQINTVETKKTASIDEKHDLYFTIVSPMIGTFYRSPAPNEKPFISANDTVKASQTVCIIEAMKLMNEIESEVNGQIVEILVEDGDIVDCGQALMRVKHI